MLNEVDPTTDAEEDAPGVGVCAPAEAFRTAALCWCLEADVEEVVGVAEATAVFAGGSGYTHSALRNLHDRQVGRTSSHLTLRALQFLHPALDFL